MIPDKIIEFKSGDKINLNTGYQCDIGIVERFENGIVYWKSCLGGDRIYNTPIDRYNITLIKNKPTKQSTMIPDNIIDGFFRKMHIDNNCKVDGQKITVALLIELLTTFAEEQQSEIERLKELIERIYGAPFNIKTLEQFKIQNNL